MGGSLSQAIIEDDPHINSTTFLLTSCFFCKIIILPGILLLLEAIVKEDTPFDTPVDQLWYMSTNVRIKVPKDCFARSNGTGISVDTIFQTYTLMKGP